MRKSRQKLEDYSYWSVALIMDKLIGDEGLKFLHDHFDPKTDLSFSLDVIRKKDEQAILKTRKPYYMDAYKLLDAGIQAGSIKTLPLGNKQSPLERLIIKISFLKWFAKTEVIWSEFLKVLGRKIPKEFYVLLEKNNLIDNAMAGKNLPEIFVKNLTVWAENDSEVLIKEQGKSPLSYSHKELGFARNNTAEWDAFLAVLNGPDYFFFFNKKMGAKKVLVRSIEKKLLAFIGNEFDKDFQSDFKLIEPISDSPGCKKFKFNIKGETPLIKPNLNGLDKKAIFKLIVEYLKPSASPYILMQVTAHALENGFTKNCLKKITDDYDYIKKNMDKEETYEEYAGKHTSENK